MNNKKVENGHDLAYLIWDADTKEELDHLEDVFSSCMKIRYEQLGIHERIRKNLNLDAGFVPIGNRLVDLKER